MKFVRNEPVAIQGIIQSAIALGLAFGWWSWSSEGTGAVIGIVASFLTMFARSQVTPIANPKTHQYQPLQPAP